LNNIEDKKCADVESASSAKKNEKDEKGSLNMHIDDLEKVMKHVKVSES